MNQAMTDDDTTDDMLDDGGLSLATFTAYFREIDQQPAWRTTADREMEYVDGNQLDSEVLRRQREIGMPPAIEPLIGPAIDAVLGLEAKTRTDWRVIPDSDKSGDDVAAALNYKLNQAERHSKADQACSDAFRTQACVGIGWVEVSRDSDPFRYPYRCKAVHRNEIWWDFLSVEPDLSDARYMIRRRWVDRKQVELKYPEHHELIRRAGGRWHGFYEPSDGATVTDLARAHDQERGWSVEDQQWRDIDNKRVCLFETWYRVWERVIVLKTPDGRVVEYDAANMLHNQAIAAGITKPVSAVVGKMRMAMFMGPHRLSDEPTPYRHSKFPYAPFWGKREDRTGIPYGLVRGMMYMQDNVNATQSKIRWGLSAIAHSSFGFIKPASEFEAEFTRREIGTIVRTITEAKLEGDSPVTKRTVKQLEAIKERLENRIKRLRDKPMDDLLDFEQIGVDQLFVDEAHLFKNLMYATKMTGVAGMQDPAGSQRAFDMYVKSQQIIEKNGRGQGLVFATGTPVSNSLGEMYHMMRYLMARQMNELGFQSFDAWANTYASVEQVWMQKPSGDGFKATNRMSNFVNTPELLKLFDQVSDTVTMEDIKAAYREENPGKEFPLPKVKTGRRQPVSLEKSPRQVAYMQALAARAKIVEERKGPPQKGDDNVLVIMSDGRKAAMDIRLVMPGVAEREIGGRVDRSASEIFARYQKYDAVKGTQLVFSDMGTPIKTAKAELKDYEALLARVNAATDEINTSAVLGDERAAAIVEDAEAAQAEIDARGPDWRDAVDAALRGFSVYDDLKAALVERAIPEAEVAFIHDFNTDEQKAGLFRKVNAGQIRVLIGSTAKMGAGTNVQERLVALHHLDVPWRPSDIEQREGRIERQGNELYHADKLDIAIPGFEVEMLAYVTRDTLDMRMWQVQETKLKMINQLRTRKVEREIDNAFEDMEMSAGEMQAAATGDMDLLREIQMRSDLKKLEQRQRSFESQRNDLVTARKKNERDLQRLPGLIAEQAPLAERGEAYIAAQTARQRALRITIDGKEYDVVTGLLQRLGYNFNTKQWRVEVLEKAVGRAGAQFIETGVSSLGFMPVDISGRMGMGNLLPGTGLFTKKTDYGRDTAEIFGPAGDFAKRIGAGAGSLVEGNIGKAALLVAPKAISNAAQGADMAATGIYRDQRGKKVVDTDGWEALSKGIGFQPTSVARVQEATFNQQNMIAQVKMVTTEISDKWATGIAQKDGDLIDEARRELRQWNERNPQTPITMRLPSVLQKARTLMMSKEDRITASAPKSIRAEVRGALNAEH